jgi:hypothetical protein
MKVVKSMGLLVGVVAFTNVINAQVGGISASKVGTFCAGTVPEKDLEFEPSFNLSRATKQWDANYKLVDKFSSPDSAEIGSGFAIRCTYGFTQKFEMGISVPSDVSGASLGAKFKTWSNDNSGFSVIAGINVPTGNRVSSNKSNSLDEIGTFAGGFVFSHKFSEKLLWDIHLQGQKLLRNAGVNNHTDVFISTDCGFYPKEQIQLIGGMGYYTNIFEDSSLNSGMLEIHPGVSYETGENFLIVASSSIGLLGKNETQSWGLNLAFTMTIR